MKIVSQQSLKELIELIKISTGGNIKKKKSGEGKLSFGVEVRRKMYLELKKQKKESVK